MVYYYAKSYPSVMVFKTIFEPAKIENMLLTLLLMHSTSNCYQMILKCSMILIQHNMTEAIIFGKDGSHTHQHTMSYYCTAEIGLYAFEPNFRKMAPCLTP